jgi:outer membrane receptor protein involved in Fe transport
MKTNPTQTRPFPSETAPRAHLRPARVAGWSIWRCALALLPALTLWSQTAPAAAPAAPGTPAKEETITLETFTVTGSNIKRLDVEKVLPITILNLDAIDVRNAITPVELLATLPQVTSVPRTEAMAGGADTRGDNANIAMRGIGVGNSLILLNGRRMAPHPLTGTLSYAVNVNQLPTQGIARVEVLRDGASSIYGSDAVAGVANYIMRSDLRGTELRFRYGRPQHPGGENVQTTLTHGFDFAGGRGRLLTTIDTLYRDAIYLYTRKVSASADHTSQAPPPWNAPGGQFDSRSLVGYYPKFTIGTATTNNYLRPVGGVMTLTSVAPTRAANPEFYLDTNRLTMGAPRTGRLNWFTSFEYDLNDRVTAFADVLLYHADSATIRQPVSTNAPASDQPELMSADNPFNPYGSRFYSPTGAPNADGTPRLTGAPRTITLLSGLVMDMPQEKIVVSSGAYRITGGLRGKLSGTWKWETGALYNRVYVADRSPNAVRESLYGRAFLRTDQTAYNPFGYTFKVQGNAVVADQPYHNPSSVLSTFNQTWRRDGMSAIASLDARAAGRLLTIWSGDINLAAGAEYRREEYYDKRPAFAGWNPPGSGLDPNDNDFVVASPKPDADGSRNITSFYAESVIPLAAPKNAIPLVKAFELTASVRHERYSDFGQTTKPKVGVNWRPLAGAMVRASYNQGFSAPSLPTLNSKSQYSIASAPGDTDPYRNPATREGPYVMRNATSANPNLQPTDSTGKSIGLVLDVPKVKGLSLTVDYWEIARTDIISSRTNNQVMNADAALLQAYTRQQVAAGVPVGQINVGSGDTYKGDPAIVRSTPTAADIAAFAAYNAANPGNPLAVAGQIFSRDTPNLNMAEGFVSGWDLGLDYHLPALPIGQITFNSDWSYLRRSHTINIPPGAAPIFTDGVTGPGNTRWRGNSLITWRQGRWSGGFGAYYIGSDVDTSATTTQAVYESLGRPAYIAKTYTGGQYVYRYVASDSITYNAYAAYSFGTDAGGGSRWLQRALRRSMVRVGVVNLTDTSPPLTTGAFGFTASRHGTIFMGRTWTLELTKRF